MTERAEHTGWQAHAAAAAAYFTEHGGDSMSAHESSTYETLLQRVQDAADRLATPPNEPVALNVGGARYVVACADTRRHASPDRRLMNCCHAWCGATRIYIVVYIRPAEEKSWLSHPSISTPTS